ncbi:hypothetical protein RvY_09310-2 [Ramazzottius varieornatus]|uniref:Histone deacetylase interacting domain-containing protein n=1 Tax=Ramazzottius varieornatus TaxID=947166 RepID=A0A1D1VI14_RAMVA|nr:hypothetical protein RvY_09310-2 [Ramazzottius varieornatus]
MDPSSGRDSTSSVPGAAVDNKLLGPPGLPSEGQPGFSSLQTSSAVPIDANKASSAESDTTKYVMPSQTLSMESLPPPMSLLNLSNSTTTPPGDIFPSGHAPATIQSEQPSQQPSTLMTDGGEVQPSRRNSNPTSVQAGVSSMNSSDSLISQLAGVSALHGSGNLRRSNSKSSETSHGHSTKKRSSEQRAAQHGMVAATTHPRLKVEDALGYLDQVKIIFAHKPKVYNDFLDIMKEFKSQSLDTPGVITRVASLFRGHADLIVGFNAFLPHGYKIDIDAAGNVKVTVPNNQIPILIANVDIPYHDDQPRSTSEPRSNSSEGISTRSPASNMPAVSDVEPKAEPGLAQHESMMPDAAHSSTSETDAAPNAGTDRDVRSLAQMAGATTAVRGPEFNYAITYVNKIKTRFHDQPQKYKRFLEILHLYQGKIRVTEKALDETDVFKEVSRLFADHPDLMNDFNKFLPNACATMANPGNALTQMTLQNLPATSPSRASSSQSPPSPPTQPRSSTKPSLVRQQSRSKVERGGSIPTGKPESDSKQAAKSSKGSEKKLKGSRQKARTEEGAQEGDKQKGGPKRPLTRPLNKDGRSGKSDPLEAHKKTAKPSTTEKIAERTKVPDVAPSAASCSMKPKKLLAPRSDEGVLNGEDGNVRSGKTKRGTYRLPANVPGQRKRLKRLLPVRKDFKPVRALTPVEAFAYASFEDFSLIDRIRRSLPANVFTVLLKMFELYISRALTKGKLLHIVEKLVHHKPKLVQEFARLLQTKAVIRGSGQSVVNGSDRSRMDMENRRALLKSREPDNRAAETDFKAFERYTDSRSYRIRPDFMSKQKSSGMTAMDRQVLNEKYVSCPIFSEGSQFLISKKNLAEEAMFKCEDEKYEMDMLLASAEVAIDAMTMQFEKLSNAADNGQHCTWEDAALHRRIVTKLYTENAPIIMAHLTKNPLCTIPTVLDRIRQKHSQWIRVQNAMSEVWMEQARKNASRIGDYKGTTFKQIDMRFLRSRHLVHEMEKLYSERLEQRTKDSKQKPVEIEDNTATTAVTVVTTTTTDSKPHLVLQYPRVAIAVDDVTFFILRYIKNHSGFGSSDKKLMNKFLLEYMYRTLGMPDSSDLVDFFDSEDEEPNSSNDGKSPRVQRPSVPRLSLSTSDAGDVDKDGNAKRKQSDGDTEDDLSHNSHMTNGKKLRGLGPKELPIAPLPWPELCHFSGELKLLDVQVEEDLSEEAKKREVAREMVKEQLDSFTDLFPMEETSYVLLYGNSPYFLFVRYHQLLCERITILHKGFLNTLTMASGKQEKPSYVVSKACKPRIDVPVERLWTVFIDRLLKLFDGNIDPNIYDEEMREIFRKDAYLTFTLDRLIQSVTRQLHHIVAQERAKTVRNFWEEARMNGGAGGATLSRSDRLEAEKAYETKVAEFLKDQNCFKINLSNSGKIAIELIESEEPEDQQPLCQNWKEFVTYYTGTAGLSDFMKNALLTRSPIFIVKHHRQLSRHRKQVARELDEEDEEDLDEELPLDVTKLSDLDSGNDFSLDPKTWLMSLTIRSQIESDDVLGISDDKVPNTNWVVYRRGAMKIAVDTHRRVSQKRTSAFKRYLSEVWTKKALISQEKHKAFLNMMREGLSRFKCGNSVEAPYYVYQCCRSDESERREHMKPYWVAEQDLSDPQRAPNEIQAPENEQGGGDVGDKDDTADTRSTHSEDSEDDREDEMDEVEHKNLQEVPST